MHSKWILLAVFVVAIVLRIVGLEHQSFSMDECLEQETAEMTIDQIVWAPNSFPPLYHLLLKAWLAVETCSIAARTFSLLTSLVSVWLTWKLAKEAANEQVALIVAAIVATSPFHIYYSQQGRGYMLLILLATMSMYSGLRLMREPTTWDRMLFVLAGVAGGYTHYYFAVVLVAIGIGILLHNGTRFFATQVL
ncbi:MAG: glycosyltransferase family 39 protein, partial [Planctomycetota bacterium]